MLHIYKVTRFTFHIDQQHFLDNSSLFSFNISFVKEIRCQRLTLISVGFLGVRFDVGERGKIYLLVPSPP